MELKLNKVVSETFGDWYAPDFLNNRDLPESQRMAVRIVGLTGRELKRIQSEQRVEFRAKRPGEIFRTLEAREQATREAILLDKIKEVKNCTFEDERGNRTSCTEAKVLVDTCLSGPAEFLRLLDDIYEAIHERSKLEEGLVPKSNSRSVLQPAEIATS